MIKQSIIDRFNSCVIASRHSDCWTWIGSIGGNGRPRFSIKSIYFVAARIAYEIEYGPFDKSQNVCHSCDNPLCVNPAHLWLGTQRDNLEDMTNKGRRAVGNKVSNPGEKNPAAKLTSIQVSEIRERYSEGNVTQQTLAAKYGVSQRMISLIVRHEKWR